MRGWEGGQRGGGRLMLVPTPIAAYSPCTQSYPSPVHTSTHPLTGVTPLSVAAPQPGPCLSLVLPQNMCWPGPDIVASVCADEPGRRGGGEKEDEEKERRGKRINHFISS